MRFAKLSLLLLALGLSTGVTDSQAQLKNKVLGYRVEQVEVGDKFVYSISETRPGRRKPITKRSTLVERVIATDATYEMKSGARKLIRDTVTGESIYVLETPGVGFSINEPSALSPLRSAGQWKTYPLFIAKGKSIKLPESEQVIDLGSSKSSTKTSTSLRILGKEKIKVGKATYNCVKVRETIVTESKSIPIPDSNGSIRKTRSPKLSKQTRVATLWYSPELQMLVKYTTTHGKQSFSQTLTRYVKAPQQTAMLQKP
ncbi:MAG TPA: hypothetical protein VFH43_06835 [Candidatus Kapabacteria bacterium]|nr:hypothetical protein [Candidatus Kapabacteria bacterium]